jgi:HEAT repeat protein
MKSRTAMLLAAAAAFLLAPVLASGQTVDNQITESLLKLFPELSKGYLDLNGNGTADQTDEMDEVIPPSSAKDTLLRARDILDFILRNSRYIPSAKLGEIVSVLASPKGAIPELISLQYRARMELARSQRAELEAAGRALTPSALREARLKMEGLISTMLAAYKKEARDAEPDFVKARDELFAMIGAGYPLPETLGQEDMDLLTDIMINAIVRDQKKQSPGVTLAIRTLGRLRQPRAVPYLADIVSFPVVGREAVQALGDIGDKSALPVLMQQLTAGGSDPTARAAVITALGSVGDRDTAVKLAALTKGPDTPAEVERAVLSSLARISDRVGQDAATQEMFRARLASTDPQVRILAIRGLAASRSNPAAGDRILEALRKETLDEVKVEAIAGLRKLALPTTVQTLTAVLRDPAASEVVKKAALEAVAGTTGADTVVGIVADMLGSPSREIASAAAAALILQYRGTPQPVIASLARIIITRAADEPTLTAATAVLARLADPGSLNTLIPLLATPFPEVKKNATWALYRIRPSDNPRVVEELKRIVKSETEALGVRINAVRTLGAMRTDSPALKVWETILTVLKMRGEKYGALRYFSVVALGELGNPTPEVVDALSRAAEKDPELGAEAVKALQRLAVQDQKAEDALVRVFRRSRDTEVKVRAVEALGDLRSAAAADLAGDLLKRDGDLPAKRRVVYALFQVGGEKELGAILDASREAGIREYCRGMLEDSSASVLTVLLKKRGPGETNKDIVDVMDSLSSRLEER